MNAYVEREGEVVPAYTGVNAPRYSRHPDTTMPHENELAGTSPDCVVEIPGPDLARFALVLAVDAKPSHWREAA